jgi:hypothetical protein
MLLVLSHMRGATTALSNVLCSHEEVSGYGETHVFHRRASSPGQVVLNQMRRSAWKREAAYLFDKVLHNRLDLNPASEFFSARAIFMVRAPKASIASIVKLALETGMRDVDQPQSAAHYYCARLEQLCRHWERFDARHRMGILSETLLSEPGQTLKGVSQWLGLKPELQNAYVSHPATLAHGGGDPTVSGKLTKIESRSTPLDLSSVAGVPRELSARCLASYQRMVNLMRQSDQELVLADVDQPGR